MTTFLVSFLLAFGTALVFTPVMIGLATKLGAVDTAGISHRKVHAADIPRLGGVAIVLAFYAPLVGLTVYQTKVGDALWLDVKLAAGLLGGGLLIAGLGMVDDIKGASPKLKLAVQLGVALLMVALGLQIDRLDLPFLPQFGLGWFAIPVTVLWIVGVTNAVNLIDGLDGLAAGMALFGIVPMAVLAVAKGNLLLALVCCTLAGAVLGFLVYNFHPARIFMGDTGSMFLGFILAVVTIATAHKGRAAVAMLTPVLVLGLPILDTLLAIGRRMWFGQSVFVGDKQHIHHRLMAAGLSHRATVLVMYLFAATFAVLGLATHFNRDRETALLFLLALVVGGVLLRKIGYLAMPGGDGQLAGAIRARNLLVRDAGKTLATRLDEAAGVERFAAALSEVAFASGAVSARLQLDRDDEPVRTWTWHSAPATSDVGVLREPFGLVGLDGVRIGTLTVTWHDDGAFHDSVLPRVEAAARQITERHVAALPVAAPAEAATVP